MLNLKTIFLASLVAPSMANTNSTTACEWSIPTTPCGDGCIRNDRLEDGSLTCVNDTSCELSNPLPAGIQQLLDKNVTTSYSYLEGCYESYSKNDTDVGTGGGVEIVGIPTGAPSSIVTAQPTSSAPIVGVSIGWIILMIIIV